MKNHFILVLILVIMIPISCYGVDNVNSRGYHSGYQYVDLGLPSGTKWATMNVGAESPEDYGDYFAWGEITTKSDYSWSSYKWCNGSYKTLTKYCAKSSSYDTVDNKTILELSDDAANANWGGDWRMPTKSELDELRTECTWTWTKQKGVNGYKVTSKTNGSSIFLPAAGYRDGSDLYDEGSYGNYKSSSLRSVNSDGAYRLCFNSVYVRWYDNYRNYGHSVRAVLGEGLICDIAFDSNGGEGTMSSITIDRAEVFTIPKSKFTRPGYKFIGWNTKSDGTGISCNVGKIVQLAKNITFYAQWIEYVGTGTGTVNGHKYVDLGLPSGTLWATCNVGATKPEDYGDYYSIDWIGDDGSTYINYADDWDDDWRIPTEEEQKELLTKCIWTWTTINGVKGCTVTGPSGNSIFLPATGDAGSYGQYWSSSHNFLDNSSELFNIHAIYLYFNSSEVRSRLSDLFSSRSVRAVLRVGFTCNVAFDSNGGEGTMSSITINHAEVFSVTENKFTRSGYKFKGWNTKADGTGKSYDVGQNIQLTKNITLYAQWIEAKGAGTANGYEYVDLGLPSGTKWATMNVGANSPEDYGDYFAWGETKPKYKETKPKYIYDWSTYKWCNGSSSTMTKYCTSSSYGTVDNKTTLELSDDAANANWGGNWRMPTDSEQLELMYTDDIIWEWTTQNGVQGYKVTSMVNGNSIFLPAAGYCDGSDLNGVGSYGFYWSAPLSASDSSDAYFLGFNSSEVSRDCDERYYGISVRAVLRE